MKQIHVNGYKRITKAEAFKEYKNGNTIYLIPVKLTPGGFWNPEIPIKNDSPRKWESIINEFEFYNCDYERGYYTAFYIKEV